MEEHEQCLTRLTEEVDMYEHQDRQEAAQRLREQLQHVEVGRFCTKSTSYIMENFKHDSIKPPVWSPASSPNLSESSLVWLAAVCGFAAVSIGRDRA